MTDYTGSYHPYAIIYREWRRDWLTVERFAAYHGISTNKAHQIINKGRVLHHLPFGHH